MLAQDSSYHATRSGEHLLLDQAAYQINTLKHSQATLSDLLFPYYLLQKDFGPNGILSTKSQWHGLGFENV